MATDLDTREEAEIQTSSDDGIDWNFEMDETKDMPWEIKPGESSRKYRRFTTFLEMKNRSIRGAYQQYKRDVGEEVTDKVQKIWYEDSRIWKWQLRARAYDQHQQKLVARGAREMRLRRLKDLDDVLQKSIAVFDPDSTTVTLSALQKTFATLLDQSRGEHNELPVQKVAETTASGEDKKPQDSLSDVLALIAIARERKRIADMAERERMIVDTPIRVLKKEDLEDD